jgi:hypothetical protein
MTYHTKLRPKQSTKDGMEKRRECCKYCGKGASLTLQLLEPSKAEEFYTNNGKKDAFENLISGTSLRNMMSSLIDFINEETRLYSNIMGKHSEFVWIDHLNATWKLQRRKEGIKYSWGCAKGKYHRLPLANKRRKEKFRNLVHQCLDRTGVLIIERQQMLFSKRARQYMLAYHSIELSKKKREFVGAAESNDKKLEMSASW